MIVQKGNLWLVVSVEDGIRNGKVLARFKTKGQAMNWLHDTGIFTRDE